MRLTVAAATAAVLLAGCGGGSNGSETFREDALAICEETNDRIRSLGAVESFTQTQLFARQANDAVGDQIEALEELDPPAEQEQQLALYLETLEERRRILQRLVDAADRNSMADVRETGSELQTLGDTAREQASVLGLAACEPR